MTIAKNENEMRAIQLQGTSYRNFIDAIRSPATKRGYKMSLKRYLNHLKMRNADDLLANHQYPRLIESQIIEYIMSLRQADISYATIKYLVSEEPVQFRPSAGQHGHSHGYRQFA